MNYQRLNNVRFDLELLRKEVDDISNCCPFHPYDNQLSLRHRPGAAVPFFDGVGSLLNPVTNEFYAQETDFSEFNSVVKDCYLHQVFHQICDLVEAPIGRVRLMRMLPRTCLSMHVDQGPRIHIPIITNDQSFLVFRESGAVHLPADGSAYWVNTLEPHTAMNGSRTDSRIHLLFSVVTDDPRPQLRGVNK